MVTRKEADKIVDIVLDYFKIDVNEMSLVESNDFYNRVLYHSVGII